LTGLWSYTARSELEGEWIYIIVGIDPGIKTGYAILDLKGALVVGGCVKEASDEKMIEIISDVGVPVLVASDTHPPSHFIQKMAARLNVRVFSPRESLKKIEKREMGKEIADVHMRDAYAASIKAYRKYQNRLRQIDAMGQPDAEELKRMVITGHRIANRLESGKPNI
jgi:predicted RNase H-like nuclease (RuvC/YqgF family)